MRKEFVMPEEDREFLDSGGRSWETILDNGIRWLVVHGFALPTGYGVQSTSVALQVGPGYPDTQIDMVYFRPHLARTDGKVIRALTTCQIAGEDWQRWSRHRTAANPWRPGIDNVATHLIQVEAWLQRAAEGDNG
jgi:hypothetical protein